jgi:hypothetical protein
VYDGRLQSTYEGNVIEPVIISLRIWLSILRREGLLSHSLMNQPLPLWIAWMLHPRNLLRKKHRRRNRVLYLLSTLLDHTDLAFLRLHWS